MCVCTCVFMRKRTTFVRVFTDATLATGVLKEKQKKNGLRWAVVMSYCDNWLSFFSFECAWLCVCVFCTLAPSVRPSAVVPVCDWHLQAGCLQHWRCKCKWSKCFLWASRRSDARRVLMLLGHCYMAIYKLTSGFRLPDLYRNVPLGSRYT